MQKPIDFHDGVRGQTLKWFVMDTPDRAHFDKEGELIEYRFNQDGFRMDIEMDEVEKGCDIYIGDSTTLAFGQNVEDGWAYKHFVQTEQKNQFVNLSQASCGLDTITRLLGYWVPILEPENVWLLEPAPNRQEFLDNNGVGWSSGVWHQIVVQKMGGHEITDESYFKEKLFLEHISLDPQVAVQKAKNLDAIQWICRDTNLHYADHSPFEWYGGSRDGYHPGADQHDKILERFVRVEVSSPLPSTW